MSSSICRRCLQRSAHPFDAPPPPSRGSSHAPFSTSFSRAATPPKKKVGAGKPAARQGTTLRLAKNHRTVSGRPPAPGERKAIRKRVVLSNNNALEVPHLENLTRDGAKPDVLRRMQGQMFGLADETVAALGALAAFKPTQGWGLFRRPATLVRGETVDMAERLHNAGNTQQTDRRVLCGSKGSGKSVLVLQGLAMAQLNGWVTIHFPEARDITIAHTAYRPEQTANGETVYIQPEYVAQLLGTIAQANRGVLDLLRLGQQHQLPVPVQSNISLTRFAEMGASDAELAWPVWQALLSELTAPSQPNRTGLDRPPVFISMDGVEHIMRLSAYLDADANLIHAHKLAIVRDFVSLLAGKIALPNGGVVLASTSASSKPATPTFDHFLAAKDAENLADLISDLDDLKISPPMWDPYMPLDENVAEIMETVTVQKLHGLSKEEARGVMEYYTRSGMMRATLTDNVISERWTLAGGGIIGELEKATVRARF
ncbi:hypothetical protein M433DRAFT_68167 [Acidomyces richmondensis BFW]|nr:MAG: hypothetical protein FE78DRAFT_150073 [Acidomyces sp. 'richmondensis']KYG45023.1 hypothetical protein M433DRAFT_68167 [Acidomyces richmondensis BFW]